MDDIRILKGTTVLVRGHSFELLEDIHVKGSLDNCENINAYNAPGDGEMVIDVVAVPWDMPMVAPVEVI